VNSAGRRAARRAAPALALATACAQLPAAGPPDRLSELGLFADLPAQRPGAELMAYEVNSPLYSDQLHKWRFAHVPAGAGVTLDGDSLDWPEGTVLVKTFGHLVDERAPAAGRRLIETRLLLRDAGGWTAHTYLWNADQTDAERWVAGKSVALAWIDAEGQPRELPYRVPNSNQCGNCHARDHRIEPLGAVPRQLERAGDETGQGPLDELAARGWLRGALPAPGQRPFMPSPTSGAALGERARAYLDVNCAHCHRPGGAGGATGLDLRWSGPLGAAGGICKAPVAAGPGSGGHSYVIVPGAPEASILVFRMSSLEAGKRMPELGAQTVDQLGVTLVSRWIAGMPATDCAR
jgi:uncharacterized repeat protein (TIGR03806 family)